MLERLFMKTVNIAIQEILNSSEFSEELKTLILEGAVIFKGNDRFK